MRVCFCIKTLSVYGGAERVFATIASGLSSRGHEVIVVTFDSGGGATAYPLDERINRIGLGVVTGKQRATVYSSIRVLQLLRSLVKEIKPDASVGFMHSAFVPLGLSLLGTGHPVIASEHIVPAHYNGRPLERLLVNMTPWVSKRIICVSEQALKKFPWHLQRKMEVIPNPVMTFSPHVERIRSDVRKILLTVGRMTAQKDHRTLIQAFSIIAKQVPDWDLRIVGDGELEPELRAQVDALSLKSRVQMPGTTPYIEEEYGKAELFVLPSLYESYGLTTIEALMHGLPVVGFADCPGTNRLVRNGVNGVLVGSGKGRVEELAGVLLELMRDGDRRLALGKKAVDSVALLDTGEILDAWERLIGSVRTPLT